MQSLVMHKPDGDSVFDFIHKKRVEGYSGKKAMIAGLNKVFRVYYGLVSNLYKTMS